MPRRERDFLFGCAALIALGLLLIVTATALNK